MDGDCGKLSFRYDVQFVTQLNFSVLFSVHKKAYIAYRAAQKKLYKKSITFNNKNEFGKIIC